MGIGWDVERVATCPSTNVELVRRAKAGEAHPPFVLIADQQTAGQGRNGRTWITPAHGAITMSALVNPQVPAVSIGLFPLFSALAVCRALRQAGYPASAKWPNDILLPAATPEPGFGNWRKVGGILCQAVPSAGLVVGIGINVTQSAAELPVPTATSLASYGPAPDVAALQQAILTELAAVLTQWEDNGDAALRDEFGQYCITIGQPVAVHQELAGQPLAAEPAVSGVGQGIAADGGLVIKTPNGQTLTIHAGDVSLRMS